MASVDTPVALLGYGTVGAAVNRLLTESAADIERATGHRLRVVKALVRDVAKERDYPAEPLNSAGGVLTDDFADILDDPSIPVVAEVMGGLEPAGDYVLELLRRGRHVVTANKQLVARRGAELFAAASEAGVQLRFEASVCAAIPVIKVLREALVVTNVHRVLGIVNGTTNFVLTEMEAARPTATRSARRRSAGSPRRTRPTTSPVPTPLRRWRFSRRSRSTRVSISTTSTSPASPRSIRSMSPPRASSTW